MYKFSWCVDPLPQRGGQTPGLHGDQAVHRGQAHHTKRKPETGSSFFFFFIKSWLFLFICLYSPHKKIFSFRYDWLLFLCVMTVYYLISYLTQLEKLSYKGPKLKTIFSTIYFTAMFTCKLPESFDNMFKSLSSQRSKKLLISIPKTKHLENFPAVSRPKLWINIRNEMKSSFHCNKRKCFSCKK